MTPRTAGALFSAALSLVALSGCARLRLATDVHTLTDVNLALMNQTARIHYVDRAPALGTEVVVGLDSTSYKPRHWDRRKTVATARIEKITVRSRKGKAVKGALIGVIPGVLLAAFYGGVRLQCENAEGLCGVLGIATVYYGGILALSGSLIGASVGASKGERLIVYDGELARYLPPGM